ncbi:MAG: hypothetical protein ACT4QE_09910 [Anaerolineales bacterium]
MSQETVQHASAVKRKHEAELLRKANVVAVGVGYCTRGSQRTDEVGIIVSVKRKVPAAQLQPGDVLPWQLEGVPVDVVETGEVVAQ